MRIVPIACMLLLAGCATPLDTATLHIDGGPLAIEADQAFSPESRSSEFLYKSHNKDHADFYTAHDLLLEWSLAGDHDLEVEWYDSSFGYGYALCAIDDFPPRVVDGAARGCFERDGFWAMTLDGESVMVAMGEVEITPGAAFALTWTPY